MRLLLISDTHGDLDWISQYAEEARADAVIHAGDFGFYDRESIQRLSDRELALRIRHSSLPRALRRSAFKMSREEKAQLIRERAPLSQLPDFLSGELSFQIPVYAVWGNHEDPTVLADLRSGEREVSGLHLIDERAMHRVGRFEVLGLGGNVLWDEKLLDTALAGRGGQVWSTLEQFGRLAALLEEPPKLDAVRIFVCHVSPGKEGLMARLAAHGRCDFLVSGHMGSPYPMLWNAFATRELAERDFPPSVALERLMELWETQGERIADDPARPWIERGLALLSSEPLVPARIRRGKAEPEWYRGLFLINLPDAVDGYAVLEDDSERIRFESRGRGLLRRRIG